MCWTMWGCGKGIWTHVRSPELLFQTLYHQREGAPALILANYGAGQVCWALAPSWPPWMEILDY